MTDYSLLCYDSLSESFVSPMGAVAAGNEVSFRLRLSKKLTATAPRLLFYANDVWDTPAAILPMTLFKDEPTQVWYQARFSPQSPQLFFYRFDVMTSRGRSPIMRDHTDSVGVLGCQHEHWQLTVYDPAMRPPTPLLGGLVYHIFPDRFCNSGKRKRNVPADRLLRHDWGSLPNWKPDETGEYRCNDYFGGDIEGIVQKLPYLKALGVTSIYLNPIFEAHSNHRYNTADYNKLDPLLGTEKDFKTLCAKAAELSISIILDGVFSHTGSDSIYFNREGRYNGGAFNDPSSPYRRWYRFKEDGSYSRWWNFETLPEVNENDSSYLEFISGEDGVIAKWMKLGASGWRLDVADELPDIALDAICMAIRQNNPDAPIIGEVWEDASNKSSYGVRRRYLLGEQLSSVMNYPLGEAILAFTRSGDCYSLYRTLLTQRENYPPPVLHALMNCLSTHDVPRAITALAGENDAAASREWQHRHNTLDDEQYTKGKALLKIASALQYTLPGVPSLYYGDEAGLYGYRDPFNRGCYPWGKEDTELLEWYTLLGQVRASCPCLAQGEFSLMAMGDTVFSFTRRYKNQTLFVTVNRSDSPCSPALPPDLKPQSAKVLVGDQRLLVLPAYGVIMAQY